MKFHLRFDIPVDIDTAQSRFVNRVHNWIFDSTFFSLQPDERAIILRCIAYELGKECNTTIVDPRVLIGRNFFDCLQAIEAFYLTTAPDIQKIINDWIEKIVEDSEVDVGIRWEGGRFLKSGAKLLDDALVNESLHWLTEKQYTSVYQPYSKGLDHFLRSSNNPPQLSDVITDMYESLEALAKIITGRNTKDLSSNCELFIKTVKASDSYKKILKEYISYANSFRHGDVGNQRPALTESEVESFVYLTGIFIRLAIRRGNESE